jgi:hypothetical protein
MAVVLALVSFTKGMNQAENTKTKYDYTLPRLVDYEGDMSK